ncbi:hypothetical protein ACJZ2D_008989 [Fusarium nematophilum]
MPTTPPTTAPTITPVSIPDPGLSEWFVVVAEGACGALDGSRGIDLESSFAPEDLVEDKSSSAVKVGSLLVEVLVPPAYDNQN